MLITLREYERIYKVINTLVVNEGGDPAYACILFSAFGSYILEKHHKINAQFGDGPICTRMAARLKFSSSATIKK